MRAFLLIGVFSGALCAVFTASAQSPTSNPAAALWEEIKAKREKLTSLHQEFEVSQVFKTAGNNQASKHQVIIDMAPGQWREGSVAGSGDRVRIFDGKDLVFMEEGGSEFVKVKRKPKDDEPLPSPYRFTDVNWAKAVEVKRLPCGLTGTDHTCVVLSVPVKPWMRGARTAARRMQQGTAMIVLDTETGLLISARTVELIERSRDSYQSDISYGLKRQSYGKPADAALFKLPSDLREVKELTAWDAARIKKQLVGKMAPQLAVNDLQGKPVTLESFKGKTVLLDFWTTWCPPCRADAPALDKLYKKYADQDLMIVGVSVNEDRPIVEKFLKEHPHSFPVVLTTENEMPRPYQIGVFPTYMIIEKDGTLSAAVEGDQGFGELRKLLKKAGLDLE